MPFPASHSSHTNWRAYLARLIDAAGGPWGAAIWFAVAPYLAVRSWVNGSLIILGLIAAARLKREDWAWLRTERELQWLVIALCAPLALVGLVQVAHWEFRARSFDAASRLALAAVLLVLLYARRVNWLRAAGIAFAAASLASAALVYLPGAERYYWGPNRAANYFVDPLSLAQHSALLAFLCLFSLDRTDRLWARALKLAGFAAGLSVAVSTGSRTGWSMVPLLALLWVYTRPWMQGWTRRALGLIAVLGVLALALELSPTVQGRMNEAVTHIAQYLQGHNPDTSEGIRLSLFRVSWAAFLEKPVFGWGFIHLPTAAHLPATQALWTPIMTGYFVDNGTHNEWLQALMLMGLAGLLAKIAMYLVPLAVFVRAIRLGDEGRRHAGHLGLVVVIAYLASGMTSEVSNLIYLSSFYGLMIAALGAAALPSSQRPR